MKPQKISKKINIIVVILVLLIGITFGSYLFLKSKPGQADQLEEIAQTLKDQPIVDDIDYDGLKDWEEKIYGTNPLNPDTDKDGYLDGEEVAAGYDPTKPAPDDKLASEPTPAEQKRPEPGNLTQTLTYLLVNQLEGDQFPLLPTAGNINSLAPVLKEAVDEKVMESLQRSSTHFLAELKPDFDDQIKTISDNNLIAIRNYAKEASDKIGVIESCQDCHNNIFKTDDEVIQECIENQNYEQANCLADSYLLAYQELLEVSVPTDWLNIHKKMLSVFWGFHKVYQYIPEYEKDPLKGIIILKKYEEASKNFMEVIEEMKFDLDNR